MSMTYVSQEGGNLDILAVIIHNRLRGKTFILLTGRNKKTCLFSVVVNRQILYFFASFFSDYQDKSASNSNLKNTNFQLFLEARKNAYFGSKI
jgi:hypothetical protein